MQIKRTHGVKTVANSAIILKVCLFLLVPAILISDCENLILQTHIYCITNLCKSQIKAFFLDLEITTPMNSTYSNKHKRRHENSEIPYYS